MKKFLHEIFSDGSLADNRSYQLKGEVLTVYPSQKTIQIRSRGKNENNLASTLQFLRNVATKSAKTSLQTRIVMIGDGDYEHNTNDDFFILDRSANDEFNLTTGNLVGRMTGKVGDYKYSFNVSSRFGDEFLKYIIADADGFAEMPHGGGDSLGNLDWLLIYYWIIKLKKAFRLGLPKTYVSRTEITPLVRGRIDPLSYFLNGDRAQYGCTFREHSYNNGVTQLIAKTLQVLDSHAFLRDAHVLNQMFQVATDGKSRPVRELFDVKPLQNQYYADYNPVVDLSKQILRNEYSDFGDSSASNALLFDASMLFEYFIRKLLKRAGVRLYGKSSLNLQIPRGLAGGRTHRKLIPDLIFEINDKAYVFDVKYKSYDFRDGVAREDLFQIHTYVSQLSTRRPVAGCGFIYPIRESRWNSAGLDANSGIVSDEFCQGDRTVSFHVVFLKVPELGTVSLADWPAYFHEHFRLNCEVFVGNLLERLAQKRPRVVA